MTALRIVRLAPLDERTWKAEDDAGPVYSPFNTRFADSIDDLEYEACELHADDVVVELDVDASSISKDGTRLIPNRAGPRTGRVRVTLDRPNEPPMIYTMAGLYSNRQPGHALALRAIVATLKGLRDLDRWGVVRGRQYTGMLAIESGVAMGGGDGDGVTRDRAWAIAELADLTGLPESSPLADLFGAARYHANDDAARERLAAARAVISGQEALERQEDFERWRAQRAQGEIESGDDHG